MDTLSFRQLEQIAVLFNLCSDIVFPMIGISFVLLGIRGLMGKSPELNLAFIQRLPKIIASISFLLLGFLVVPIVIGDSIWNSTAVRVVYFITATFAFMLLNYNLKGNAGRTAQVKNPEVGNYYFFSLRETAQRLTVTMNPSMVTYLYFWITSAWLWFFGIAIIVAGNFDSISHIMMTSDSIVEFALGIIVAIQGGAFFVLLLGLVLILIAIGGLVSGIFKVFFKATCIFDKKKNLFCFHYQRYRPFKVCHEMTEIRSFNILTENVSRHVHGEYLGKFLHITTLQPEKHHYLHVQTFSGKCPALFQTPVFDRGELEKIKICIQHFLSMEN